MKPVYIDITNIPELERYTGISRVVSEIASKMICSGTDVRLIAYFPNKHGYRKIDSEKFLLAANGMLEDKRECYTDDYISIDDIENDSIFYDCNSAWHTLPNRSYLLPKLKSKQVKIVVLIYDLIPIRHPEYMVGQTLMRFMEFLTAHMTYADDIVVNTNAVKEDVQQLFRELSLPEKPIHCIGLGADFTVGQRKKGRSEAADLTVEDMLSGRRFLLTVGTVEPRKNHKVIVEAYEKALADMDIDVVFVGRIGWQMEGLLERIKSNRKYNRGIYILSGVNDTTLDQLYKKAFMVVFPSYTEGYGLPTIEAMIKGVPTACSDIPVMREVGGRFCDYFNPDNSQQLIDIVKKYAENPQAYEEKRLMLQNEYKPPKWEDTAREMLSLLQSTNSYIPFEHKPIRQVVFLSARPAPLLATLPFIEEFMPFITSLVVCCPDFMADYLHQNYKGRLELTTITDDQLLDGHALPPDHSTRNFFLRCLAMKQETIDDEFIMCDDDYRPLKYITEEVFYKDGKYKGYYFSDISKWHYKITKLFSYDYCHFRTKKFLKKHGYPTLQYSSHQPQVINKVWYNELIDKYPDITTKGYDEWSTYFNYIAVEHRQQYQPCRYVTLAWPDIGGENKGVTQPEYVFENFYEDNYMRGKPFANMSPHFSNPEKIVSDNNTKNLLALKFKAEHQNVEKRLNKWENDYERENNQLPYVAAWFTGGVFTPADLAVPASIEISRSKINVIKAGVSRTERCAANFCTAIIEMSIVDEEKQVYFAKAAYYSPRLDYNNITFFCPKDLPEDKVYSVRINARLVAQPAFIEKFIPISFVD